jgi:hypothetical protein
MENATPIYEKRAALMHSASARNNHPIFIFQPHLS